VAPTEADATAINLNETELVSELEIGEVPAPSTHFVMGYQVEFTGTQHCTSMAQPL
jgi:hypothetical protein